jgi:hypothetical protein
VVLVLVEGLAGGAGERDVVRHLVERELGVEGRARGERRGDAGDEVARHPEFGERVHLFEGGAVDRRVAAVEAGDRPAVLVGIGHQRHQLLQVLPDGVDEFGVGAVPVEQFAVHQRPGVHDQVGGPDEFAPANRQ